MKKLVIFCLAFFLFTSAGIAEGQNDVSLSILDIHSTPSSNVEMVVSVLDEQGRPIKELSKVNFKLNIEGKDVKEFSLEPVSSAKNPLSIIIGIDVSGSMNGAPIAEAKKAASIFLDQIDKEDFISLMVFGSNVRFLTDFTQKKHEVREKMDGLVANEMWTWLYQATHEGLIKASKAPTSRVAMVLLTDGKDEGSPRKEEDVVARIGGIQIPIYTIGFGPKAEVEYLKRVAGISGGYFLFTPKAEELSELYGMVLDQLKNQYLIGFSFPNPVGNYTSTVTLNYRGKEITARRGFLHAIVGRPIPWWKELFKNPVAWGIMVLTMIILAIGIPYLLRRPKPETPNGEKPKSGPQVSLMINKKIHPMSFPLGDLKDVTKTVIKPSLSRGEVGLDIDVPPMPLPFSLIDKKNKKKYDEVIITRYDKDKDHLFSKEKVYLLLSDNSVSRPDEERYGHARVVLEIQTGTYKIEDLGSSSETKVKDSILSKGESITLRNGDTITVGGIALKYYDRRPLSETEF